ncbi:hypothetical protein AVEN_207486-1 [Araneus ventricosus]|uniref:Uncharacterized protein n=1 Tax=Araneus ventricosus TaxID=182803 RepID=A0A4Y2EE33_ARAVE|nr:hypothetical protein AVEN_207486-1 [Araneus ventricosus]
MLEKWQTSWKNGDIGRKIYNIMPSVSLHPTNWIREDVIFFSQHGPFPACLKSFRLSDNDYCSCGGIGTALHYAMECIYTVCWHMRKPAPNLEQEWLKRVSPITSSPGIKFVGLSNSLEKTEIFSGLPSLQLYSELN